MSAKRQERLIIDVTKGDCVEENRKNGKSNTGTYFISSIKDFENFKHFFKAENNYVLSLSEIKEYQILFKSLFASSLDKYNGKGLKFDSFCNYLLSLREFPKVEMTLRINDSRVFMRFKNNKNVVINSFRNLLYEDISTICIEKSGDFFRIFPSIVSSKVNFKQTKFVYDDFGFDD